MLRLLIKPPIRSKFQDLNCFIGFNRSYTAFIDGKKRDTQRIHDHSVDIEYKFDNQWPEIENPSPREIFGLNGKIDKQKLNLIKGIYRSYVKLYHPDVSHNIMIFRTDKKEKNDVLSEEEKILRFKLITSAKSLLTEPGKQSFDNSWPKGFDDEFHRFQNDLFNQERYKNPKYWEAGNWEEINRSKSQTKQNTFQEDLSSIKVFVMTLFGFVVCLKVTDLLHQVEDSVLDNQNSISTDKS